MATASATRRCCAEILGGSQCCLLQLPSPSSPAVTPTTFVSLQSLESLFRFVEPGALVEAARGEKLTLGTRRIELLATGKAFEVLRFMKHVRSLTAAALDGGPRYDAGSLKHE